MRRQALNSGAALLAITYAACSAVAVAHSGKHLILNLVLVQYAFLLPAVVCFILGNRRHHTTALARIAWSVAILYFSYALLVNFVAAVVLHKDKGLQYGDEAAYKFEARVFLHGCLAA